jgi:hypothetical protein
VPLTGEAVFSQLYFLSAYQKSDGHSLVDSYLGLLFHWSSYLFLCQYNAVFIAMAMQYSLKSGIVIPAALLFCSVLP